MADRVARPPKLLRILRSHVRLFGAAAIGIIVTLSLPDAWRPSTRILLGWDVFAAAYVAQALAALARADIKSLRAHASALDEGAAALLVITVAAAVMSLGAIVFELGAARAAHTGQARSFLLATATTALSWALVHVIFAVHYTHLFYLGPGERGGGL
jgi:uncharacterized membrane protein